MSCLQDLWRCSRLTALFVDLDSFARQLATLPIVPGSGPSLRDLELLWHRPGPAGVPNSVGHLTMLTSLRVIAGDDIIELPRALSSLVKLKELTLEHCILDQLPVFVTGDC